MSFFSIPTLRAFPIAIAAGCIYTTSTDANTIILLHGENFTDYSPTIYTITNNNATSVASPSKGVNFCNSMSFNGSSAYLTLPIGAAVNGLSTYTVEGFFYLNSLTAASAIITPATSNGLVWYIGSDGKMVVGDNVSYAFLGGTAISTGTWYHLAVVANGSGIKIFINGTLDTTGSQFAFSGTSQSSNVGKNTSFGPGGAGYFNGNIDEFRISNTARYSSNFTPPSAPFA